MMGRGNKGELEVEEERERVWVECVYLWSECDLWLFVNSCGLVDGTVFNCFWVLSCD